MPIDKRGLMMFGRYLGIRVTTVAVSLLIAIFLVVFIANLGGKLDELVYEDVKSNVGNSLLQNKQTREQIENACNLECRNVTADKLDECKTNCKNRIIEEHTRVVLRGMGLDPSTPPYVRMYNHYIRALKLDFGRARYLRSYDTRSDYVLNIIAEALPRTVLLFTTANIIIFFIELFVGLWLSRRYGTLADKISVGLAPLSTMPGWFYGIFILMLLSIWPKQAFGVTLFPSGGWMSYPPPEDPFQRALDVLWHMVLPILSWIIAYVPIGVYNYRTFFLIFSTEEHVEYARARGVPEKTILRRYILRPTLPPIITTFVLMLIGSWMGAIITESVFSWPGLGTVLNAALGGGINIDSPVVVGITVIYAYLLAASVIALDIIYGIVDPRVRVKG